MSSQPVNYSLSTCDRILNLLRQSEMGSRFKEFFYGDPLDIPTDHVPCVIAELQNTNVVQGPTGMDYLQEEILIKLVINRKSYFDIQGDNELAGQRALEEMVQGIDPSTSLNDTNTILGILRQNFTLTNFATNQTFAINYGIAPRGDDFITAEAHIKFIVDSYRLTPSKQ